jgi:hypothetical protein
MTTLLSAEPAIDVVTAERIVAGVTVAHRRAQQGAYRPESSAWTSRRWPACHEPHVHGCDNERNGESEKCQGSCRCVCRCGEVWHQVSALGADGLGAVPCPEPACFGGRQ